MKRRLFVALLLLLALFAGTAELARRVHAAAVEDLSELMTAHRVASLNGELAADLRTVQMDLLAANTPWERDFDEVVRHGEQLGESLRSCQGCHHDPAVAATFRDFGADVSSFEEKLSFVLTAEADAETLVALKREASDLGEELLGASVHLRSAFETATASLEEEIEARRRGLDRVLWTTLVLVLITFSLVAIWLVRAVTGPVRELVEATRSIRRGELGSQVEIPDDAELGALARNFNRMSRWLESGYEELGREIEERRATEVELRRSESFLASGFESLADPFVIFDAEQRISLGNQAYAEQKGRRREELVGCRCEDLREHCSGPCRPCLVELALAEGRPQTQERRVEMPEGEFRWLELRTHPVKNGRGETTHVIEHVRDITNRKEAEAQLEMASLHDPLTGLPNRTLFMRYLEEAVAGFRDDPARTFAVLFLDLDRFKVINDTQGHDVGDALLMAIAARVSDILREGTLFARLGGDEFVVLLDEIEEVREAVALARRIREVVAEPLLWKGQEVCTSVSIGVAPSTESFDRAEDLVRYADVAMYRAKGREPGQIALYDDLLHREIMQGLSLESELRHALSHDELEIWYQPILDVRSGRIAAFEALLRWRHPKLGVLGPSRFLAQAEESGLIHPIGLWTFRHVLERSRQWISEASERGEGVRIAVNLTSLQLAHAELASELEELLAATHADARRVTIELTEGSLEDPRWSAYETLEKIRELGFRLCLDNFGAGNLALGHLRKVRFDSIKIDRSLIEEGNEADREILLSILDLARRLHLDVVAEGVESQAEIRRLREQGCQMVQGSAISVPVPKDTVEAWLGEGLDALQEWGEPDESGLAN